MGTTEVVVGRIGRPHGTRGEVSVTPSSDEPDRRFSVGAILAAAPASASSAPSRGLPTTLTVRSSRWHSGRLLLTFDQIVDRTAAEACRGVILSLSVPEDESPEDPEEFYDHQLVGMSVSTTDAHPVGDVVEVLHTAGQDLLVVRRPNGEDALVPFVAALVPLVDVTGRRIEVADRPGLLTPLDEADS